MKIFFAALFLALGMLLLSTVHAQSNPVDSIQNPDIFLKSTLGTADAEQKRWEEFSRHETYEHDRDADIKRQTDCI